MITVRVAGPADEQAISEVTNSAVAILRKTYRPKKAALRENSRDRNPRSRLVALMDDRLVGTVQYATVRDGLHLIGLFVHPHFQRQEVARQLVQSVIRIGQRKGARCLSINTVKETGNVVIYEKLGFHVIPEGEDQKSESDKYERLTDVYFEMKT